MSRYLLCVVLVFGASACDSCSDGGSDGVDASDAKGDVPIDSSPDADGRPDVDDPVVVPDADASVAEVPAVTTLPPQPPLEYLRVSQVALGDLDPALATATGLVVTQEGGPTMRQRLGGGNVLRFLSPDEQFHDDTSTLRIVDPATGRSWLLPFEWTSRLSSSLVRIEEAGEGGQAPADDDVTATIQGVDALGAISADTAMLSIVLSGAAGLDPKRARISLHTAGGAQAVQDWFSFNGAGVVSLNPTRLPGLLDVVRAAKKATLTFSLSTAGYKNTYVFEQTLTYSEATIQLKVVNADGTPAIDLANAAFVLRGFNSGLSRLVTLDAHGQATIKRLNADTFEARQVLLETGIPLAGYATLPAPDSVVELTISRAPVLAPKAIKYAGAGDLPEYPAARGVLKAGPRLARRGTVVGPAFLPAPLALVADYTVSVTASTQDALMSKPVSFTVPKGSLNASVKVEVSTAEFPTYVKANSQFNDVWVFSLRFPDPLPPFEGTGKVNQSHAQGAIITFERCLDVAAAAKDADLPISGTIGAQNVADAALPTRVTVSIAASCDDELHITAFDGLAKTADGNYALYPRAPASETSPDGNVAGQYLSLPQTTKLPTDFGLPATLLYTPKTATIDEVELFVRGGGTDTTLGKAYLSEAKATQGQLRWPSLTFAPAKSPATAQRVQIVAVLRGKLNNKAVESKAYPLTIDVKYTNFTPIYLASDMTNYMAARRYPTQDEPGGDSWATKSMLDWLFATDLVYNDLSAAMVKQSVVTKRPNMPRYRSVLGHSGHSDGQQADVRYWDGTGGFSAPLNGAGTGAGIALLAKQALAEVTSGDPITPKLLQLQAWIAENRTQLDAYAARPEVRRIYIGNDFIASLLIDGLFPDTITDVPSAGTWAAMSAKILPQPEHLHHWHVNVNQP